MPTSDTEAESCTFCDSPLSMAIWTFDRGTGETDELPVCDDCFSAYEEAVQR